MRETDFDDSMSMRALLKGGWMSVERRGGWCREGRVKADVGCLAKRASFKMAANSCAKQPPAPNSF